MQILCLRRFFIILSRTHSGMAGNPSGLPSPPASTETIFRSSVKITVEGVPDEFKEAIFRRQYFKHTGFGLFLSREILGITGLSIRESGEPGKGARFEITVPRGIFPHRRSGRIITGTVTPFFEFSHFFLCNTLNLYQHQPRNTHGH